MVTYAKAAENDVKNPNVLDFEFEFDCPLQPLIKVPTWVSIKNVLLMLLFLGKNFQSL